MKPEGSLQLGLVLSPGRANFARAEPYRSNLASWRRAARGTPAGRVGCAWAGAASAG
jgi:hypothetical protein